MGADPQGDLPIVFANESASDPNGNGLGLINGDGTGRRLILTPKDRQVYSQPDLSADGRRIAFVECDRASAHPDDCRIRTVNADGSGLRTLPGHRSPRWSPDGTRIAFNRMGSDSSTHHLATMAADGSDVRDIPGISTEVFDWGPDGKTLALFGSEPASSPFRYGMFTVPADGSGRPRLLLPGRWGITLSWSPDGTRIAFTTTDELATWVVRVINPDGSGERDVLTSDPYTAFGSPGWSPDSRRLAIATRREERNGITTRWPVSIHDLASGAATPLMEDGGATLSWANPGGPLPCGSGYWVGAADGRVFSFGSAPVLGSAAPAPGSGIVGIVPTPSRRGYWLAARDGGVSAAGDARLFGSPDGRRPTRPVVGMASSPTGHGYWLVDGGGGVFAYGDAKFFGSTAGQKLNKPIVGLAPSPTGHGYWLVAGDGGVFAYGDARFFGPTTRLTLNKPIVAMASSPTGLGYRLVAGDGGTFHFGDAANLGSAASPGLPTPVAAASSSGNNALLMAGTDGSVIPFGDARFCGSPSQPRRSAPVVGVALATQP